MKFITLVGAAILAVASPALAFPLQKLSDRNAGFSIEFPGEPRKESEFNSEIGAQVTIWEYTDSSSDEFTLFEFYLVEFPQGWQAHNPREHAAAWAHEVIGGSDVASSKDTTVGNRGGREITARVTPDRAARSFGARSQVQYVKVVTVGNRVFVLNTRHTVDTPDTKARNFVSSFRTLK